jgi:hypothetical protein
LCRIGAAPKVVGKCATAFIRTLRLTAGTTPYASRRNTFHILNPKVVMSLKITSKHTAYLTACKKHTSGPIDPFKTKATTGVPGRGGPRGI